MVEGTELNPYPSIFQAFTDITSFPTNESYQLKMINEYYDSNLNETFFEFQNISLIIR